MKSFLAPLPFPSFFLPLPFLFSFLLSPSFLHLSAHVPPSSRYLLLPGRCEEIQKTVCFDFLCLDILLAVTVCLNCVSPSEQHSRLKSSNSCYSCALIIELGRLQCSFSNCVVAQLQYKFYSHLLGLALHHNVAPGLTVF